MFELITLSVEITQIISKKFQNCNIFSQLYHLEADSWLWWLDSWTGVMPTLVCFQYLCRLIKSTHFIPVEQFSNSKKWMHRNSSPPTDILLQWFCSIKEIHLMYYITANCILVKLSSQLIGLFSRSLTNWSSLSVCQMSVQFRRVEFVGLHNMRCVDRSMKRNCNALIIEVENVLKFLHFVS